MCRGFSRCFSYDEKQFFPVSRVVAFRSEERFLLETSKEYRIYAMRRQCGKEKCTKHDKCVGVTLSSFRVRYIFRDIAAKCPRYAIHDNCVAGLISKHLSPFVLSTMPTILKTTLHQLWSTYVVCSTNREKRNSFSHKMGDEELIKLVFRSVVE